MGCGFGERGEWGGFGERGEWGGLGGFSRWAAGEVSQSPSIINYKIVSLNFVFVLTIDLLH